MMLPHSAWEGLGLPHARPNDAPWLERLSLWERRAALLLVGMATLRFVVASASGLSDTEAYYLTWSRFPDWSYYDHPPLLAWILAATTTLSRAPSFVRIGSVISSALFGFLVYRLTARLFASPRAGFLAALVVSIVPAFFFTGFLANPEAPLAPLWVAFLLTLDDLRDHDEPWRPLLVGAVIGVGFLAKYTALLAVPVALLFVALSPAARRWLRRPTFYAAGLVALLLASPVILWNHLHGWPSVTLHLVERMSTAGAAAFVANARHVFLSQLLLFHPLVFPGLLVMLVITLSRARSDGRYRLLAVASAPVLLFLFTVMVRASDAEPHWTMVGYVPLAVASGGWGDEQLARVSRAGKAYVAYLRAAVAFSGLVAVLYTVHVATPIFPRLLPPAAYDANADPINETLGWDRVREVIASEASRLGPGAVVVSEHNVLCGHLDVADDDQPPVYCASPRRTEFDFLGRRTPPPGAPVVYVDSARYPGDPSRALPGYDCTPAGDIPVERGGRPLGSYRIQTCTMRGEVTP